MEWVSKINPHGWHAMTKVMTYNKWCDVLWQWLKALQWNDLVTSLAASRVETNVINMVGKECDPEEADVCLETVLGSPRKKMMTAEHKGANVLSLQAKCVWCQLEAQGGAVSNTVLYKDSLSDIMLAANGQESNCKWMQKGSRVECQLVEHIADSFTMDIKEREIPSTTRFHPGPTG